MSRTTKKLAVFLTIVLSAMPASAWNERAHKLIGHLAFRHLNEDERDRVHAILKKHPHYEAYLTADRPASVDPREWAFMTASYWPDWVREPRDFQGDLDAHWRYKFSRPNWHYVNFPYRAGQTAFEITVPVQGPDEPNVLQQLGLGEEVIKDLAEDEGQAEGVDRGQNKAVRVCWLFHLSEDIHQPLHAATLVSDGRLLDGDRGGNFLAVKRGADSAPVNLHSYWDGVLGDSTDYHSIAKLADELLKDPSLARDRLSELTEVHGYRNWAKESYELAAKEVYLGGDLPIILWVDKDEQDQAYRERVPTLPGEYNEKATEIGRRRTIVASYRLADKLRQLIE